MAENEQTKAVDPNMKPELDEFDHPIHWVSKVFPGLHIGEYVENWLKTAFLCCRRIEVKTLSEQSH